jgi:hypothetical protein
MSFSSSFLMFSGDSFRGINATIEVYMEYTDNVDWF